MAVHRGRFEENVRGDQGKLRRTFTHPEMDPPRFECGPYVDLQGTALDGTTLFLLCVDFDDRSAAPGAARYDPAMAEDMFG